MDNPVNALVYRSGHRMAALALAVFAVCSTLGLAGCSTAAPSNVTAVEDFEIERYLGTWHEIARLDHRFERGLTKVTATYSRRDDGGVRVINRGYDEAADEWKQAEGRAYFRGDPTIGSLKVSFFGPFYGGYHIFALDHPDYEWALVSGQRRDYLWILARSPHLDRAITAKLVDKARAAGFAVDELIWLSQESKP